MLYTLNALITLRYNIDVEFTLVFMLYTPNALITLRYNIDVEFTLVFWCCVTVCAHDWNSFLYGNGCQYRHSTVPTKCHFVLYF